jgi:hypothetical protein
METRTIPELTPDRTAGNNLPSLIFISAFIFLQSIIIIPVTGQNDISAFQSEKDYSEVAARRDHTKSVSYSFLKVFFQLSNSYTNSGQIQITWAQNQLIYSLKVTQTFRVLESSPSHLPIYLHYNVVHSNQDENSFI